MAGRATDQLMSQFCAMGNRWAEVSLFFSGRKKWKLRGVKCPMSQSVFRGVSVINRTGLLSLSLEPNVPLSFRISLTQTWGPL